MAAERAEQGVQHHNRAARYRQIVEILTRHGLGFALGAIGHETHHAASPDERVTLNGSAVTTTASRRGRTNGRRLGGPEHMRLALEELGPTFVKIGQILSTRGDLLPQQYLDELALLQDSLPPVPEPEVRAILAEELDRPIEEAFASFDLTPLASASIGQAHAATLPDGTEVVVKLRRPHVVEQVESDLQILLDLAARASHHWEAARHYDLLAIAQEFAQTLRHELDYLHEAQNIERIADNFGDEPGLHIPRVFWQTTTSRMLTLERIYGVKFTDTEAIEAQGLDRAEIAHRAARLLLTMIVDHGFFHADPHPGNVLIERGGQIGLIDFGMVGEVDGAARDLLVQLMISIARQDASRLADVMLDLGLTRASVDRNALRRDLQRLLMRYSNRALQDVKFGMMLGELLDVIRWHHLRLAPDLALLVKTLAMGEGLAARLDPTFNLMEVYLPLAEELMRRQFDPGRWLRQMATSTLDAMQMSLDLPQQLRHVLGDIERGGFEVTMQPASFTPLLHRLDTLVSRLILALLTVGFLITAGILAAAAQISGRWEVAATVLLVCLSLCAIGFGMRVVFQLWRTRHSRS
ncbi:MAG TPA: AarF/ABC1/UbiB kinase family protein [Ktedonobacterales bacterium]|nr:AarF/ABC1/UbiB kinase family protein [Ktedonobacterales bacterium]